MDIFFDLTPFEANNFSDEKIPISFGALHNFAIMFAIPKCDAIAQNLNSLRGVALDVIHSNSVAK